MTVENPPFEDVFFPIEHGDFPAFRAVTFSSSCSLRFRGEVFCERLPEF